MPKKKEEVKEVKVEEPKVEEPKVEEPKEAPKRIANDFGREDLNELRDAVNELFAK